MALHDLRNNVNADEWQKLARELPTIVWMKFGLKE
jgi:hypothetical protein